jgi:hypothetical protein
MANTPAQAAAEGFISVMDAKLDSQAWRYLTAQTLQDRLLWHKQAAEGSLDWFTRGQAAVVRSGRGPSHSYAAAIESAQGFLTEVDIHLAALEAEENPDGN